MVIWSSYRRGIGGRFWDVNRLALWRSSICRAFACTAQRCIFCSTGHRQYFVEVWQLQRFPLGPHGRVWPRSRRGGTATSRRTCCWPDIWVRAPRLGRTVPHGGGGCKESISICQCSYISMRSLLVLFCTISTDVAWLKLAYPWRISYELARSPSTL